MSTEQKMPADPSSLAPAPIETFRSRNRVPPHLRIKISPLAARIAEHKKVDLSNIRGTGPDGRIIRADLLAILQGNPENAPSAVPVPTTELPPPHPSPATAVANWDIPHQAIKLSGMRKTIARRLTESKQQVPHIYLTVDIRLDALLKLRSELNAGLSSRNIKLSVNDLLIKALAVALLREPSCNVQFAGDGLLQFERADISVAVSIPNGLITPIIVDAGNKGVAQVSSEMRDLASRAKEGRLAPPEYQGGTASLSNMGMFGIKQFGAVINPPQAMIMAVGAGEKRPWVSGDGLVVAAVMTATGSFDHRAIDGSDGARLMQAFRDLVETPHSLLV